MTSYYNRLQMQLTDSREMEKLIKPFKVSRKIVVIKSASECYWYNVNPPLPSVRILIVASIVGFCDVIFPEISDNKEFIESETLAL